MAYSELIKNFDKIREYMREFYVYGLKIVVNTHKKALARMMMKKDELKAGSAIICVLL